MGNLNLSAPWITYWRKMKALFAGDPDIEIGEIEQVEDSKDYAFDIMVGDADKYMALDRVLNRVKIFGNITLIIRLMNASAEVDDTIEIYKRIFDKNPIVKNIKVIVDNVGVSHGYVRFWPEVVQFFDDDLTDYDGNYNGLAEDIAREAFDDAAHAIYFCTANVRENDDTENR